MSDLLPHGGLIRKLWISEAEAYRDHLLRLDPDSRRNRFAGAVSDQFVSDYANLSSASTPSFMAFSSTGSCAAPPSCGRSERR